LAAKAAEARDELSSELDSSSQSEAESDFEEVEAPAAEAAVESDSGASSLSKHEVFISHITQSINSYSIEKASEHCLSSSEP